MQQEGRYLPDGNHVGVLTAAVLLAYALTRLINTPGFTLTLQLPGFYFAYPLTLSAAMTVMATGLTATGMNWLLHSHPSLQGNTIEHWLLPTLTAFIIGASLDVLPFGTLWWIGLAFSAEILVSIFIAEYVSMNTDAPIYAFASAALTALSYALFLMLVIALRAADTASFSLRRLFSSPPDWSPCVRFTFVLAVTGNSHGRLASPWPPPRSRLVCITGRSSPLQFGLILLGPLYALTLLPLTSVKMSLCSGLCF